MLLSVVWKEKYVNKICFGEICKIWYDNNKFDIK